MKEITVKDLFEEKKKDWVLSLLTNAKTLENKITDPIISRPGLALSGYLDRFCHQRIQLLGETEISYIQSLREEVLFDRIKEMFTYNIPCLVISKGLTLPPAIEYIANEMNIAIISSRLTTVKLSFEIGRYLRDVFAPELSMHGTLLDVFGVGVLLSGKSGIGKSECALDLVERGHQLITDDMVRVILEDDTLIGSSMQDVGHFMEIRGVGVVDIERMFGIEAVRQKKKVDTQIELMPWHENMDYERLGLNNNTSEILGVAIPITYLPVSPGKNVSVIIEVIAMNFILKLYGYDAAEVFVRKMQEQMSKKTRKKAVIFNNEENY